MKATLHRGLFVAFVAVVVACGNLKARLFGLSPAGSPEGALAGLGVAGLVLVGARLFGLSAQALGIGWSNRLSLRRCVGLGVGCGLVAGLGPALAVVTHLVPADRPEGSVSWQSLFVRILFYLPVDTVLPEELAFRGLVLGWLLRAGRSQSTGVRGSSALWSVILAAVPFVFWHLELARAEMSEPRVLELTGKLVAYALGGVLFGVLRVVTGHLATSLVAHWVFDGIAMIIVKAGAE